MSAFDPAVLAAFLKRNATKLGGIVRYSHGQWAKSDIQGEAYLAAIDLGDKRGRALDLDDPQDEELLLRRLRSGARSAGGVLRGAERPDQHSADEVRSPRSWETFEGDGGDHPASLLEALESAAPEPELVDPYHSEIAAWRWLLQHFDRRMKDIAEFLLISTSWCRQCRRRARYHAENQWQLTHQLLVGEDDAQAIQPWRKFKLPAREAGDSEQLAIDLWNRPLQPVRGQLWLL